MKKLQTVILPIPANGHLAPRVRADDHHPVFNAHSPLLTTAQAGCRPFKIKARLHRGFFTLQKQDLPQGHVLFCVYPLHAGWLIPLHVVFRFASAAMPGTVLVFANTFIVLKTQVAAADWANGGTLFLITHAATPLFQKFYAPASFFHAAASKTVQRKHVVPKRLKRRA